MSRYSQPMPQPDPQDCSDILSVGMKAHGEVWVVLFIEEYKSEAMRTLGRWASNLDLAFTWYDAARVAKKIETGDFIDIEVKP